MIRFYFLILLLFATSNTFAQHQWSALTRGNLGLGSSWARSTEQDFFADFLNDNYSAGLTSGGHLAVQFQWGQHPAIPRKGNIWAVELGLGYQQREQHGSTGNFTFPGAIDPIFGFVRGESNENLNLSFRVINRFLEAPIRATYYFQGQDNGWFASAGVISAYYFEEVVNYEGSGINLETEAREPLADEFQIFGLLAGGYRWNIGRGWGLEVGIQGQHSLKPLYSESIVQEFLWSAGLDLGLKKSF